MEVLIRLLEETKYDPKEISYLRDGFTNGFDIGYQGPTARQSKAANIPLNPAIGNQTDLWNKLMKEVKLGRVAGPFENIPFDNYIQSPIGLVPKSGGKARLIFPLSYDFDEERNHSLNYFTPKDICSVKYKDLDHAVKVYLRLREQLSQTEDAYGKTVVFGGKTDVQSAFRLVPLKRGSWQWLVMKAHDPKTGQMRYFVDKCLPFGASISCAVFQRFSNALKFLTEARSSATLEVSVKDTITNYLDDFLFLAICRLTCNRLIEDFLGYVAR